MMKNYLTLAVLAIVMSASSQTVWDGEPITFTKENNADFTLEENQDRITDNVWITRGNNSGLLNWLIENADGDACGGLEPSDTEWASGTTADFDTLSYFPLGDLIGCNFENIPSVGNLVVHLITDDIYIDVNFVTWTNGPGGGGPGGGGFSYLRSTDPALSLGDNSASNIILYPNPAQDQITFSEITEDMDYDIFDLLGKRVASGIAKRDQPISITDLTSGVYFIRLNNSQAKKFIKN